jgi:hypothetical protein
MIDIKQKRAPRKRRKRLPKPDVARLEVAGEPPMKGNILAALRHSPLVGADLNLVRSRDLGRKVDL